jgi:hypothetical protein
MRCCEVADTYAGQPGPAPRVYGCQRAADPVRPVDALLAQQVTALQVTTAATSARQLMTRGDASVWLASRRDSTGSVAVLRFTDVTGLETAIRTYHLHRQWMSSACSALRSAVATVAAE